MRSHLLSSVAGVFGAGLVTAPASTHTQSAVSGSNNAEGRTGMFRKARRYGGVVVLGLVLTSSIALAQQSTNRAAFSLGFMADAIKYGDHSPWLVSATEDGKLVMRNSERPSSWQIYGKKAPTQNYNAKVEVISDIKAGDEAVTGAGVFFG